jgi:hydrogenase maturation protease
MTTLIIGLGNPIRGDDGVGWKVAKELSALINPASAVEIDYAALGGLSLMERMLGYARVILIDSMETGQNPEGHVSVFPLADLKAPFVGHSAAAHDASLMEALEMAQSIGAEVPGRVDVVAIEAKNVYDFSEEFSREVEEAVPVAVQEALKLLEQ